MTLDPTAAAWERLDQAAARSRHTPILDLFAAEPDRLARLTADAAGLTLDLSKQSWSRDGLDAVLALARAAGVETARDKLFAGAVVNRSEGRAVLHPALRAPDGAAFFADGVPVSAEIEAGRGRMKALADGIRAGDIRGATGKTFAAILHIGIPDKPILHGSREDGLVEAGLDYASLEATVDKWWRPRLPRVVDAVG